MKNYTITICTNDETLRGSRSIDDGLLDDACVEACDAAVRICDIFEIDNRFDPTKDVEPQFEITQEINGTFADWNGGCMSGDHYFRVAGAQKHGHVVIKCDDIDAEIPQELVALAEAMDKAISDTLDEHDDDADEFTMPAEPVVTQTYRQPSKPGHAHGVEITLADGVDYAYVTMNGKTYYLDDSTDEGICECN